MDTSDEEKANKEDELDQIFEMNEVQIHAMLAEAVANKGKASEEVDEELK